MPITFLISNCFLCQVLLLFPCRISDIEFLEKIDQRAGEGWFCDGLKMEDREKRKHYLFYTLKHSKLRNIFVTSWKSLCFWIKGSALTIEEFLQVDCSVKRLCCASDYLPHSFISRSHSNVKEIKYAKLKSYKGNRKFNLQKNADGEPLDGFLLCLHLLGEIH